MRSRTNTKYIVVLSIFGKHCKALSMIRIIVKNDLLLQLSMSSRS